MLPKAPPPTFPGPGHKDPRCLALPLLPRQYFPQVLLCAALRRTKPCPLPKKLPCLWHFTPRKSINQSITSSHQHITRRFVACIQKYLHPPLLHILHLISLFYFLSSFSFCQDGVSCPTCLQDEAHDPLVTSQPCSREHCRTTTPASALQHFGLSF